MSRKINLIYAQKKKKTEKLLGRVGEKESARKERGIVGEIKKRFGEVL